MRRQDPTRCNAGEIRLNIDHRIVGAFVPFFFLTAQMMADRFIWSTKSGMREAGGTATTTPIAQTASTDRRSRFPRYPFQDRTKLIPPTKPPVPIDTGPYTRRSLGPLEEEQCVNRLQAADRTTSFTFQQQFEISFPYLGEGTWPGAANGLSSSPPEPGHAATSV